MADVMVLCYHAVSPSWDAVLSVTPGAFERQLEMLVGRGWRGATFSQALFDPPARRTVAVTFDDAFASVIDRAYPILSALGFPATVFAPSRFMSKRQPLNWPGIDQWMSSPFASELESMSWDDLEVLSQAGWEIGSHTRTHPHLTALKHADLLDELEGSRAEISERLGRQCTAVAYPYGDFDDRVADAARTVGYAAGATLASRQKLVSPHRCPRVGVYHGDQLWRFGLKVNGPLRRLLATRLGRAMA